MTQISNQLTFEDAAKRIYDLTMFSRKDEGEVLLSYYEELGELCQEVKIALKVAGTEHKKPGVDGVFGECADVWICAMSYISIMEEKAPSIWLGNSPCRLEIFKNHLVDSINPYEMMMHVMNLALGLNNSENLFLNKVHEKLDKWEKNVKFRQAVDTVFEKNKELLKRLAQ